ncbi:MAG: exodeoxyribonuclease V subunit gamma [Deltaproteobacteria bacterium]|nr:exodeoxyribonuclease V subunit gamma [Deltaproteobacteria bacterium]
MTPEPIYTHYSNRTEALVDALVQVVATQQGGPFARETIVVQGRGMAAYLTQRLAGAFGVFAHGDFSFPRKYTERCVEALLGQQAAAAAQVSEDQLTWLVLAEFESCLHDPAFARLGAYLKQDERGTKRFQLARRLGTLFDRYITYRPELVQAWSQGDTGGIDEGQQWQAALWRRIEPKFGAQHFAAVQQLWHAKAQEQQHRPAGLPERVCVFGISSLPPAYVRVLLAASRWVQTHIFVFSPSDKDWWNSTSRTEWARAVASGQDPQALYLDPGHPLVSSCGTVGADFRRVLGDTVERLTLGEAMDERYQRPDGRTLLSRLQARMFDLHAAPTAPVEASPIPSKGKPARTTAQMALPFLSAAPVAAPPAGPALDGSISIHACHSPMREVQVCRDQLLALMTRAQDPVAPHEVVVMMTDVETYAPFVEAVFGEDPTATTHIPFRIADRKLRADSPVVDAFFRALDLVGSRMSAPAVLDLITASAIESRLGLQGADLDLLTEWLMGAGVRWGLDADHRQQHGQPANNQNTWEFGLDRLLLGYALPTAGQALFAGVLPYDEIEGKQAADLGVVVGFLQTLFGHIKTLQAPRTVPAWREAFLVLLSDLVGNDEASDWQHQHIRQALGALQSEAESAGFTGDVDLGVMRAWLQERVDAALPERGFLAGGVTFCAMVPMRSIPFRVVCILGLNDGAFPRATRTTDFDLVVRGPQGPQPGDRDRRLDDRYLFLETLCAAREQLLITYTGQSVRDNAVRPPSVLLSELLDALVTPEVTRDRLEQALVVRHPLQGFSRRYFTGQDARLWSYAGQFHQAASRLGRSLVEPPPFVTQALPPMQEAQVAFSDLQRFFNDPLRFFLQRRVRVDFPEVGHDLPSREPTQLSGLQRHDVGSRVLAGLRGAGQALQEQVFAVSRATGLLPFGSLGQVFLEEVSQQASGIAAVATGLMAVPSPPVPFDKKLSSGVHLVGTLDGLYSSGAVSLQFGRLKPGRQLRAWVSHLMLCWLAPADVPPVTMLIGPAPDLEIPMLLRFRRVEQPQPLLQELVTLFLQGQQAPLRFQADAAFAFVDPGKNAKRPAMERAVNAYRDASKFLFHWTRALGDDAPPFAALHSRGPAFEELAERVVGPLLAHRTLEEGPRS